MTPRRSARLWRIAAPLIVGAVVLALWEAVVRIEGIAVYILPGPIAIAKALWTDGPSLLGSLLGDVAHHAGRTRRGRHSRRRHCAVVLAVAAPGDQPLPLRRDFAGDADRGDSAVDHHLGAAAVCGLAGLRLDRRLFPDRLEHHDRAQQRRPQPRRPVPALRRLPGPDPALSASCRPHSPIFLPGCGSAAGWP